MIKSHNEIKVWFEVQCRSCLQGCDSSDDSGRMILVDDVDNREFLCKLVEAMYSESIEPSPYGIITLFQ